MGIRTDEVRKEGDGGMARKGLEGKNRKRKDRRGADRGRKRG